jgi:hypothetical protein
VVINLGTSILAHFGNPEGAVAFAQKSAARLDRGFASGIFAGAADRLFVIGIARPAV